MRATERDLATAARSALDVSLLGPAHQVVLLAGATEAQTFFQRLDRLVAFFRSFRQKPMDVESPATSGLLSQVAGWFGNADESPGSVYLAMCQQQAGVCRHRALCFVVTALAAGIVARYLSSDTHAWAEVQVPQSKSRAALYAQGLGIRPVPQWHRIELGGGAANIKQKEHPDGDIPGKPLPAA